MFQEGLRGLLKSSILLMILSDWWSDPLTVKFGWSGGLAWGRRCTWSCTSLRCWWSKRGLLISESAPYPQRLSPGTLSSSLSSSLEGHSDRRTRGSSSARIGLFRRSIAPLGQAVGTHSRRRAKWRGATGFLWWQLASWRKTWLKNFGQCRLSLCSARSE